MRRMCKQSRRVSALEHKSVSEEAGRRESSAVYLFVEISMTASAANLLLPRRAQCPWTLQKRTYHVSTTVCSTIRSTFRHCANNVFTSASADLSSHLDGESFSRFVIFLLRFLKQTKLIITQHRHWLNYFSSRSESVYSHCIIGAIADWELYIAKLPTAAELIRAQRLHLAMRGIIYARN